jgi:glycosyltransferase involved in cell wall biosynthesis
MHILFLTDNFPPEVNAPASRTFDHCRIWAKAGHQITVITGAPNFPTGEVFSGYRNKFWQTEEINGIRIIRVWTYITKNEGFAKRTLDYLSFMLSAFLATLFVRKVDLVIGTSPQFFTACAAFLTGVVKQKPWIFELRDIWPESIRAVSAMKQSILLDILEKIEIFLYRRASAIIAVTNAFKVNLINRGIDGEKIHVITNGSDIERFKKTTRDEVLAENLGLQERFVAGYIGTHGMAHGLETLIETALILKNSSGGSGIRLMMLGDGAERASLIEKADRLQLDNLIFISSVSKDEVVRYWALLKVAIVHLKKNDLFKTVIPSKIFEAMAMGVPILHGVEGESASIVIDNAVGWTFEPENATDLAEKLILLQNQAQDHARMAENGPVAASRYDRRKLAIEMLNIIQKVAQTKKY